MRVVVLGASGRTGRLAVKLGLGRDWEVVAAVRDVSKMEQMQHPKLTVKEVDLTNVDSLATAFQGCQAVVNCLGAPRSDMWAWCTVTLHTDAMPVIVKAMRQCNVRRLVVVSAWWTESHPDNPRVIEWLAKPLFFGRHLKDLSTMEQHLVDECQGIQFTVVRTPELTDRPLNGQPLVAVEGQYIPDVPWAIPRADVANFMLDCIEKENHIRQLVAIALPNS